MTDATTPSVDRLAGQLRYLLDERPELQTAPLERIRDRLSAEDRTARARASYPFATEVEIRRRAGELDDRIPLEAVQQAMSQVTAVAVDAGARRNARGERRDDTPRWLFGAAAAIWIAGLVGWVANLAVNGLTRSTWTGGALLVVMGAAIGAAISSRRDSTAS
jgi:hypothetical protein